MIRKDILTEVQALYGISEDQAIKRLAAEQAAAELDWRIGHMAIEDYAGSWFDQETWNLNVAISDTSDAAVLKRLGATPVKVARSLAQLQGIRKQVEGLLLDDPAAARGLRETYIDYRLNKVVVGVAAEHVATTGAALAAGRVGSGAVKVIAVGGFSFSTDLHGADGMCDATYGSPPYLFKCHIAHPCSVGASVEGGFVAAGHCGEDGDPIHLASGHSTGPLLGHVADSTMNLVSPPGGGLAYSFAYNEDGAWVDVDTEWTPQPEINNYGPGSMSVSAQWAGMLEAPVGATVCRYGQTTSPAGGGDGVDGADCGPITAQNVTRFNDPIVSQVDGLTVVEDTCSLDGDSGGPFITATGQVQGTLSGHNGDRGACPIDVNDEFQHLTFFQPIATTLSRFQPNGHPLIMLTTHGTAKPTIHGAACITGVLGIPNHFVCSFDDYESQGETTLLWSASGSSSSSWPDYSRFCTPGQWVYVDLAMTNPYGTAHAYISFQCP